MMVFDVPKATSNRATKTCVQAARANCRFISWLQTHVAASQRNNNGSQTNKASIYPSLLRFDARKASERNETLKTNSYTDI